eukprot:10153-Prymnesium_polylepis.1
MIAAAHGHFQGSPRERSRGRCWGTACTCCRQSWSALRGVMGVHERGEEMVHINNVCALGETREMRLDMLGVSSFLFVQCASSTSPRRAHACMERGAGTPCSQPRPPPRAFR